MSLLKKDLTTHGYLREIIDDNRDYTFIAVIVIEYIKQGFAKYFEEESNEDFLKHMQFGDIVRKTNDKMMVLDEYNELQVIGDYNLDDDDDIYIDVGVDIPKSICSNLDDAIAFYSKFNQTDTFLPSSADSEYNEERDIIIDLWCTLSISYDDEFIIDKFGGPLKPEYTRIKYYSIDGKFGHLTILYSTYREKRFFAETMNNWNYKDIIKFHELRLDKDNMTKIYVKGTLFGRAPFVSNLWEHKDGTIEQEYVGPKDEKAAMLQNITEFYATQERLVEEISIEEVNNQDMTMYDKGYFTESSSE